MTYNIWNKWDPLEVVMLGSFYPAEFFQDIKNHRIRSALQRIADEEAEDGAHFERVLIEHGVGVIRPQIDPSENIMHYMDDQGRLGEPLSANNMYGIPRAPIAPRDNQFVLGNHLFLTEYWDHPSILQALKQYEEKNIVKLNESIEAPSYTVVNQQLFIDTDVSKHQGMIPRDKENLQNRLQGLEEKIQNNCEIIQQLYPDIEIKTLSIGAHNDGIFATVAPGAILSVEDIHIYEQDFPGWEVCYMPDEDMFAVEDFIKHKVRIKKSWWLPGEEDNTEFTDFVETWLQDWVGYAEETVSAVNVLMINPETCCTVNATSDMKQFMKKHGIDCVDIPNRHRFILDSGLHCKTLDLKRKS